jgi:PleD family two-component response regulator
VERERAERDALTGLLSHRSLEEALREEIDAAEREGRVVSLAFVDIDRFKALNDAYGHPAGDQVIRAVAAEVAAATGGAGAAAGGAGAAAGAAAPAGAVAARFGGEEFALLLPGMEREQAFLLVERVRAAVEDAGRRAAAAGTSSAFTVSGGVAAFPADGRTRAELWRKVDAALYRAKAGGRNRVCMAQEERMATKTSHYTLSQLERLAALARDEGVGEAVLLREALDDLLTKYKVSPVES